MMKTPLLFLQTTILAALLGSAMPAYGDGVIALHQGSNDPTAEGFTSDVNYGPSSAGPVTDDMGQNAWNITSQTLDTQASYYQVFSPAEDAAISTQGFTLTVDARVASAGTVWSGGGAPFFPSLDDRIDFGNGLAFDLTTGLNSNGDTVVMLATEYQAGSPYYSVTGPAYTLNGSGASYNLFQLVYDPSTMSAALYVNGVEVITGYTGQTQFYYDVGLVSFAANNGGSVNYSLAEAQIGMDVVPEPSSLALAGIAAAVLGALFVRRCQRRVAGLNRSGMR